MPDDTLPLGNIEPIEIQEEMERSFLDYAMSVITSPRVAGRARRVEAGPAPHPLWDVHRGHAPRSPAPKVGQCCRYRHGELPPARRPVDLRRARPDGARLLTALPARRRARELRFTRPRRPARRAALHEARLAPLAMELLGEIDKETVDYEDTYDGQHQQPSVLPARFPNLLVNGGGGIAVGMATNIPPHNLREVIDAVLHLIDNPEATTEDLMQFVTGPDFPTGATISAATASTSRTAPGAVRSACAPLPRSTSRPRRAAHRRHRDPVPNLG